MPSKSELLFAKRAIQEGHLTETQVMAALAEIDRRRDAGEAIGLETYLAAEGMLPPETTRRIVEAARTRGAPDLAETAIDRVPARTLIEHPGSAPAPKQDSGATLTRVGQDPLIGRTFGTSVRVIRLLGEGGMGAVYIGRHLGLDKDVVVKILPPAFTRDAVLVERFLREARSCGRLDHPNVVHVYDVGATPDGIHYITMEYVAGRNLEEVLAESRGALPLVDAIRYAAAVASALEAAHAKGIVHRDIKPANVLVSREGAVKVTDFGLALDRMSDSHLSQPGEMMGTPYFMSPEQCEGKRVDERSDVYSLGALFYNLVTGQRLFVGPSAASILVKHIREVPTAPTRLRADLSADVERVILKMLAKDPADRYASAAEVRAELERLAAGEAPQVAAVRRPVGAGLWAAVAAGALVLAAVLVLTLGGGGPDEPTPEPAGPGPNGSAVDPAEEAWQEIQVWRAANPDDHHGYRQRIVAFLRANGETPQVEAAREALKALLPQIQSQNEAEAGRIVKDLLESGRGERETGVLQKMMEDLASGENADLALEILTKIRDAIDAGQLLKGRLFRNRAIVMLDGFERTFLGRKAMADGETAEAAGRHLEARNHYARAAASLREPEGREDALTRRDALDLRLASSGIRIEGPVPLVAISWAELDPTGPARPDLDRVLHARRGAWRLVPSPAPEIRDATAWAGRGILLLDEFAPILAGSSGEVEILFVVPRGPDPTWVASIGLDTDGPTAMRLDLRHVPGDPPAGEVGVWSRTKDASGFAPTIEELIAHRPGETGNVEPLGQPDGSVETHLYPLRLAWRATEASLDLALEPLHQAGGGRRKVWNVDLAAHGHQPASRIRLWIAARDHDAHLFRIAVSGRLERVRGR